MDKQRLDEIRARAEDEVRCAYCANPLFKGHAHRDVLDLLAYVEKLEAVLGSIASMGCCQTPGCNINDPKCDPMFARAVLREDDNA